MKPMRPQFRIFKDCLKNFRGETINCGLIQQPFEVGVVFNTPCVESIKRRDSGSTPSIYSSLLEYTGSEIFDSRFLDN